MTEVEQPPLNGIDLSGGEDDENHKSRPADIEQDMREMERRKRVEAIMDSKLFREELERIVDSQIREGGASGILQQLSDIVGVPASRVGSVFKSSNCVLPINDIRGVESMGYAKGEKILRSKLAATFRLLDLYGWTQGLGAQITARFNADQELFLVNPFGLLFHEVTASSLNKVDMQGQIVEQGTTNFGINNNQFVLHSVVHAARPDIRCAIYLGCNSVVAISSIKQGLLPLTKDSAVLGEIAVHPYSGALNEPEEREKLVRSLGPIAKVLLLNNHGALCCGETIEEAFYAAYHVIQACETQLKLLPVGLDNLVLIPEETRKSIYDASRRPPDGFEALKTAAEKEQQENASTPIDNKEKPVSQYQKPKWRVGGAEFEALMRMLDNAGFRTGYIYRHPLVKSELPKPKNDVEVPPAVSSLGYLLEEEELYRQGIWKKGEWRKGGDRTRWLNSPNVYQKVEVLETGTPDPKKITKWVVDSSPTHSTPVKIEHPLQFVPVGTNPREFKKLQQQIKDNRRADKISAGPQSHILEGVTWDEANRIKDATVSQTGDHVVLMGAASKGIIQRGYQHNATVYKAPYAKNPFDNVTDDELNEYKKTVEKKKNIHGEYTDTDFSESEALSSLQTSGAQQKSSGKNALSQSETEDASEHQVMRIETKQAPKPSQPEVVLSDASKFIGIHRKIKTQQYIDMKTLKNAIASAMREMVLRKMEFLYKWPRTESKFPQEPLNVFMIHKINHFPDYTYPLEFHTSFPNRINSKPYRTLSHFGFNYPIPQSPAKEPTSEPYDEETDISNLYLNSLKKEEILENFTKANGMQFISSKEINFVHSRKLPYSGSGDDNLSQISFESFNSTQTEPPQRNFHLISDPESENVMRGDMNRISRKRARLFSTPTPTVGTSSESGAFGSEILKTIRIAINIEISDVEHPELFKRNEEEIAQRVEKLLRNEFLKIFKEKSAEMSKEEAKNAVELFDQELENLMNEIVRINQENFLYKRFFRDGRHLITKHLEGIQKILNDNF